MALTFDTTSGCGENTPLGVLYFSNNFDQKPAGVQQMGGPGFWDVVPVEERKDDA